MKLLYLTNVQIPADDAQNLQVQAMSRSFFNFLGDDFLLILPLNQRNKNISTEYKWKRIGVLQGWPRGLKQIIFLFKSFFLVRKFKPDVIYTRDVFIAWFYKRTAVYEIHKPFTTKIGNFIFKSVASKIKIVAISQILKDFIVEKYKLDENNVLVAHDGVDLDIFNIREDKNTLVKKYLNLPNDNFVALYSGSLQKGKGVELIIKAAIDLPNISFVIIGGDQKQIDNFQNVPANVYFFRRKSQREIPFYLKAADLLILPMNKELSYGIYSSPLKLFEYMASGTPVLASNFGAIREVLSEKNSFLFDPEDANDLVEKIKYISDNNEKAIRIAKESLKLVKEYTWQKRVEKIINFLECQNLRK